MSSTIYRLKRGEHQVKLPAAADNIKRSLDYEILSKGPIVMAAHNLELLSLYLPTMSGADRKRALWTIDNLQRQVSDAL